MEFSLTDAFNFDSEILKYLDPEYVSPSELKEKVHATDILIESFNVKCEEKDKHITQLTDDNEAINNKYNNLLIQYASIKKKCSDTSEKYHKLEHQYENVVNAKGVLEGLVKQLENVINEKEMKIANIESDYQILASKKLDSIDSNIKTKRRQLGNSSIKIKLLLKYVVLFGKKALAREGLTRNESVILTRYQKQLPKSLQNNETDTTLFEDTKNAIMSPASCTSDSGVSCLSEDNKYSPTLLPSIEDVIIIDSPVQSNDIQSLDNELKFTKRKRLNSRSFKHNKQSPAPLPSMENIFIDIEEPQHDMGQKSVTPIKIYTPTVSRRSIGISTDNLISSKTYKNANVCTERIITKDVGVNTDNIVLSPPEEIPDSLIQSILKEVSSVKMISPIPWSDSEESEMINPRLKRKHWKPIKKNNIHKGYVKQIHSLKKLLVHHKTLCNNQFKTLQAKIASFKEPFSNIAPSSQKSDNIIQTPVLDIKEFDSKLKDIEIPKNKSWVKYFVDQNLKSEASTMNENKDKIIEIDQRSSDVTCISNIETLEIDSDSEKEYSNQLPELHSQDDESNSNEDYDVNKTANAETSAKISADRFNDLFGDVSDLETLDCDNVQFQRSDNINTTDTLINSDSVVKNNLTDVNIKNIDNEPCISSDVHTTDQENDLKNEAEELPTLNENTCDINCTLKDDTSIIISEKETMINNCIDVELLNAKPLINDCDISEKMNNVENIHSSFNDLFGSSDSDSLDGSIKEVVLNIINNEESLMNIDETNQKATKIACVNTDILMPYNIPSTLDEVLIKSTEINKPSVKKDSCDISRTSNIDDAKNTVSKKINNQGDNFVNNTGLVAKDDNKGGPNIVKKDSMLNLLNGSSDSESLSENARSKKRKNSVDSKAPIKIRKTETKSTDEQNKINLFKLSTNEQNKINDYKLSEESLLKCSRKRISRVNTVKITIPPQVTKTVFKRPVRRSLRVNKDTPCEVEVNKPVVKSPINEAVISLYNMPKQEIVLKTRANNLAKSKKEVIGKKKSKLYDQLKFEEDNNTTREICTIFTRSKNIQKPVPSEQKVTDKIDTITGNQLEYGLSNEEHKPQEKDAYIESRTIRSYDDLIDSTVQEDMSASNLSNENTFISLVNNFLLTKTKRMKHVDTKTVLSIHILMMKYLTDTITLELLDELISKIRDFDQLTFVEAVVKFLAFLPPDTGTTLHIPMMHNMKYTQQTCLCFLLRLIANPPSHYQRDTFELIFQCIEYKLFSFAERPILKTIEYLTHFYVIMCHVTDQNYRLKLLCFNTLYCLNYRALPILSKVLKGWPYLIPSANYFLAKDPLVIVMVHVMKILNGRDSENLYQLGELLNNKYGYESTDYNNDVVLNILIEHLNDIKSEQSLRMAFILFAKKCGVDWCYKKILQEKLLPMMEDQTPMMKEKKAFIIKLIGPLIRPFPAIKAMHCQIIIKKLTAILKRKECHIIEEAVIESLTYFSKKNFDEVVYEIVNWQPMKPVSAGLLSKLKMLIGERKKKFWQNKKLINKNKRKRI